MLMTDEERFVATAVTGVLFFGEDKYNDYFKFVENETGYLPEALEDLAEPDILNQLEDNCRNRFDSMIS